MKGPLSGWVPVRHEPPYDSDAPWYAVIPQHVGPLRDDGSMDEPRLDQRREWSGEWWLADAPEQTFGGVLTYEPKKELSLRLIGGWRYTDPVEPFLGAASAEVNSTAGRSSTAGRARRR